MHTEELIADEEEEAIREGACDIMETAAIGEVFEKQVGALMTKEAANQAMLASYNAKRQSADELDEPDEPPPPLDAEAHAEMMDDMEDEHTERKVSRRKFGVPPGGSSSSAPASGSSSKHLLNQKLQGLKGRYGEGGQNPQFVAVSSCNIAPRSSKAAASAATSAPASKPASVSGAPLYFNQDTGKQAKTRDFKEAREAGRRSGPKGVGPPGGGRVSAYSYDSAAATQQVEAWVVDVEKLCCEWHPSINPKNQGHYAEMVKFEKEKTRRCMALSKDVNKVITTQAFRHVASTETMDAAVEARATLNHLAHLGKCIVASQISEVNKFESAYNEIGKKCLMPSHMTLSLMKSLALEQAKFSQFAEVARTMELNGRFASLLRDAEMTQEDIQDHVADFLHLLGIRMLRNLREKDVFAKEPLDQRSPQNGVAGMHTMYRALQTESNGTEIMNVCKFMVCMTNPAVVPIHDLGKAMAACSSEDETGPSEVRRMFKHLLTASIGSKKLLELAIDTFDGRDTELQVVNNMDQIKDALESMATAQPGSILMTELHAKFIQSVEDCKRHIIADQEHGKANEEEIESRYKELRFSIDQTKVMMREVPSTRGNPYSGGKSGPNPPEINELLIIFVFIILFEGGGYLARVRVSISTCTSTNTSTSTSTSTRCT